MEKRCDFNIESLDGLKKFVEAIEDVTGETFKDAAADIRGAVASGKIKLMSWEEDFLDFIEERQERC